MCQRPGTAANDSVLRNTPKLLPCAFHGTEIESKFLTCESHTLCEECEVESYKMKCCKHCYRVLTSSEMESIAAKLTEICPACKQQKISLRKGLCGCSICKNCFDASQKKNGDICPVCGEFLAINLRNTVNLKRAQTNSKKPCEICFENFTRDEMRTLECDHYFCMPCLKSYIESYLVGNRNTLYLGIPCVKCKERINDHMIEDLLSKEDFDKYNEYMVHSELTECPKCQNRFEAMIKKISCNACNHYFCIDCKRLPDICTCSDVAVNLGMRQEDFSQCPGCKSLYLKDEKCDHVKCQKPGCMKEFCFRCAALRSPTLEHGNHYHRPLCDFYAAYDGNDDRYKEKCEKCKEKGALCDRPKNLKVARRIGLGEV